MKDSCLSRVRILTDIKSYKKLDYLELSLEEFQMKDYFHQLDLENSRVMFWARSKTMKGCSTHYPSDPENIRNMFECKEGCKSIDSIFHWEFSNCYSHLKKTDKIKSDLELCKFYKRAINHRIVQTEPGIPDSVTKMACTTELEFKL